MPSATDHSLNTMIVLCFDALLEVAINFLCMKYLFEMTATKWLVSRCTLKVQECLLRQIQVASIQIKNEADTFASTDLGFMQKQNMHQWFCRRYLPCEAGECLPGEYSLLYVAQSVR